ncbi:hypothetical protein K438DRAFT_1603504 [Mycena galopus ATCC 62051]|nr:hypothetical protein K438DRAFT_1603504 [Mycena galopus ATCC 62051]
MLSNTSTDISWLRTSDYHNLHISHASNTTSSSVPIQTEVPAPSTLCVPGSQITPTGPSRSFTLGNGIIINIMVEAIKNVSVPATSFAEDIERLNQMWDDTSPHWRGDSVVKINTQSIALIYWPEIFKKTGLWSAHKSHWTEWKFLVERYRQGTPEEFWTTFGTSNSGRMSYTAICTRLRKERMDADDELVKQAMLEYGKDFDTTFSYRCSRTNDRVVMSKASAIAKEYKRLRALN